MTEQDHPLYLGDWIKRRRKALDLTQEELAARAGCSKFAVRKIESGERRPSKQLARLLAEALDVAPEERETFVRVARGELVLERLRTYTPDVGVRPAAQGFAPTEGRTKLPGLPLPTPPTAILGRESELAALERLFGESQCRLLTLTGPGGIGKTRLAQEFARQNGQMFPGGVCYTPLAGLDSPDLIISAIADALQFTFSGPADPQDQLFKYLAGNTAGKMLLILDNVEHLLQPQSTSGSPTETVAVVSGIIERLPDVYLLATSRERLNLHGEWTYELHGLPVPSSDLPEKMEEYSAAALFIQSAQRAKVGFSATEDEEEQSAIIKICQLLEGIPLAIELAAAWVGMLSCAEIASEIENNIDFLTVSMRDIPKRHRSLKASFDHSWGLLSEAEKEGLSRLSFFRGGFKREAAEQIAGTHLQLLASLVSKSLVRRAENGRYDLHEVIRQYAMGHVLEDKALSVETRDRHCHYYLGLAADREAALKSGAQQEVIHDLAPEMDNIRAAWSCAIECEAFPLLGSAVRSLGWMFEVTGLLSAGIEQLELLSRALRPDTQGKWDRVLGLALVHQGLLHFRAGHFAEAQASYEEAIAVLRPVDDPVPLADALVFLGVIMHLNGHYAEAGSLLKESLACARAGKDRWSEAFATYNLGYVDSLMGDYQGGFQQMQAGLEIWRDLGDPHAISMGLNFLVSTAIKLGRYDEAEGYVRESIELCEQTGNRWGMGTAYRYWGLATMAAGRYEEAQSHFRKSIEVFKECVVGWDIGRSLAYLGDVTVLTGNIDEARAMFLDALRIARESNSIPLMLDAVVGLAEVEVQHNQAERALELSMWVLEREMVEEETKVRAERARAAAATGVGPSRIAAVREQVAGQSLEAMTEMLLTEPT